MVDQIGRVAALGGPVSTTPVRTVLEGIVQHLILRGPGGNAPPSGLYLILNRPVQIDGRTFNKVYLPQAELPIGQHVVVQGDLVKVSKRDVTTTIHYAVLRDAVKLEVEPPQSMQRAPQS